MDGHHVYLDGCVKKAPEKDAWFSCPGFLYGAGLFETIRVERGQPLFLEEHQDRLALSCQTLNWPPPSTSLAEAVALVIEANRVKEGRVRLNYFQGKEGFHLLITAEEGLPYREEDYRKGCRALILPWPRNQRSPLVKLKTMNYLENYWALQKVKEERAGEGLFLNLAGRWAEGTRSNIFMVKKDVLYTPQEDEGLLPGLMRRRVIRLALRLGLEVVEAPLEKGFLWTAEEAFLTSSLMEIWPLVEVDKRPIGRVTPGPLTRFLREKYQEAKEEGAGIF